MDSTVKKPLWRRKPFRILQVLPPNEIELFSQFLETPFFNPKPDHDLIAFFHHCRSCNVWDSDLDRSLFLQISGLELDNIKFDKLVSRLNNQLTTFLGMRQCLKKVGYAFPHALSHLSDLQFPTEELEKKHKEYKRALEKGLKAVGEIKNANYHRIRLDMNLVLANGSQSRMERPGTRGLHLLHQHLDAYFFIQKLRFLCASINEQTVFNHYWEAGGEDHLMAWFKYNYDSMPDLAKIYFHAYNVLRGIGDACDIRSFRSLLAKWEEDNGLHQETVDLNGYLLNYFFMQLNSGDLDALPQINYLYDDLLANGTLLDNQKIAPEHFKNVITIKCRLGLVEEARAFFSTYSGALEDTVEGAAIRYNEAYLLYYEQSYPEAEDILKEMAENPGKTKADHYYGLDIRCLLLKSYYTSLEFRDLKEWDQADQELQKMFRSFHGYIQRKEVANMSRVRFENFRKALEKLYGLKYGNAELDSKKIEREELWLEFKSSSNLPDKGWFISQVSPQDHQ